MLQIVSLFAILSCVYAGSVPLSRLPQLDGRIVGGTETTIQKHPHQVSVQSVLGSHFCGGSLISKNTVVTAAHCVVSRQASRIQIRLGSTSRASGGQVVAALTVQSHERYNPYTLENDVAVIKLARPVSKSSTIGFIELARQTPAHGAPVTVTGWGTLYEGGNNLPTALQEVKLNIVGRKECQSDSYQYGQQIGKTMVCAYAAKKDSCQGDSGGPLVSASRLVGIVSWGQGCARLGYPGVYTDVAKMSDWISGAMAKLQDE